jgi:FdhD protein
LSKTVKNGTNNRFVTKGAFTRMDPTIEEVVHYQWNSGRWEQVNTGVIAEQPVSLTVNGDVWLTFMCSPADLEALAVGFLYNENFITSLEDIASVRVCPAGDNVDIWLHKSAERPKTWRRTSGCTGGLTATAPDPVQEAPVSSEVRIHPDEVVSLIGQLFQTQDLYRRAGGAHTTALADGSRILLVAEDIGRHNTLDKVAGMALLNNIKPHTPILVTTGRISSDMMQKAVRMGAEILISRTSPTSLSVKIAKENGITLIGYARRERFTVYSGAERIELPLVLEREYQKEPVS